MRKNMEYSWKIVPELDMVFLDFFLWHGRLRNVPKEYADEQDSHC